MTALRFLYNTRHVTDPTLSGLSRGRNQRHLFEEIAASEVTCVLLCTKSGLFQLLEEVWLGSVGSVSGHSIFQMPVFEENLFF